ncbi:Dipeptide and tripeptide permease B [anaerobic digester metagenome]
MLAGLAVYLCGRRYLPASGGPERRTREIGPAAAGDRGRILGFVAVCLAVVAFWAVYEQMGNTMALWVDNDTDRRLFGWEMPATWFQSFNPFFVFALTPLVTSLWSRQASRGREPSSPAKMALGLVFLSAAFALMVHPAALYAVDGTPVSMFWIIGFSLLVTLGELYLSPVGLSLVTKIAPPAMVSMFMGVWFLAQFCGNLGAGQLGGLWERMPHGAFFTLMSGIALVAALCLVGLLRPLARVLHAAGNAGEDVATAAAPR